MIKTGTRVYNSRLDKIGTIVAPVYGYLERNGFKPIDFIVSYSDGTTGTISTYNKHIQRLKNGNK